MGSDWHGFEAPPDQRHRIAVFAEAYGLPTVHEITDAVIERQRLAISHVQQPVDVHSVHVAGGVGGLRP